MSQKPDRTIGVSQRSWKVQLRTKKKKERIRQRANLLQLVNNIAQAQIWKKVTGIGFGRISHGQVVKDKEMQARRTDKVTPIKWIVDGAKRKMRSMVLWKNIESELQGME